ncbi:alpha/beta hydrolase [Microbacterium mangrovi]|uniref:Alpha/beta hydrolase n=1 Tax=Microbacterium mangrovi TaxID=1348253 RepID=A0A0B2A8Z6_9MICO|nr:alpha/beta hydrolase [Microbacterium mangrovi]KHK98012.1 alpha/beta hydrolase [Microbacterium mangrovi]
MTDAWIPDILGHPFAQCTLDLGTDAEGPVVATLVRLLPSGWARLTGPLRDVDVLYVHGWSDYFFQKEVARQWADLGARFFALDLRKYGRSLREGQTPGYILDLATYDEDIAAALQAMGPRAGRRLVLLGHSTGGLVLSLWASRHPDQATAVVLNSPWLEFQLGTAGRRAIQPLVTARARWDPQGGQPATDYGFYSRAQREIGAIPDAGVTPDPWFVPAWRPDRSFATRPGWLHAIMVGHQQVESGLHLTAPVLVLLSARSVSPLTWSDAMTSADAVLVVDDIARASLKLGELVTVARIEGAIHDVYLSSPEPRRRALIVTRHWALGVLTRRG